MTQAASMNSTQGVTRHPGAKLDSRVNVPLLVAVLALLAVGIVMVGSASISIADRQFATPFYYMFRQAAYVAAGVLLALVVVQVDLQRWKKIRQGIVIVAVLSLFLVFIPGLGRTVNGSARWLMMGPLNLQVSELVKLALVVYLAGYIVERDVKSDLKGFVLPMVVVVTMAVLLILEPDFGAVVVLSATAIGLLFLGGVPWHRFVVLLGTAAVALGGLAISSPYRMQRLTAFTDPWADPYNSGFQLTQALIAFGRGEWLGVGLGGSVQKLFYLPEAHTDFVFAVLGEELGLVGVCAVLTLFAVVVWQALVVGRTAAAKKHFFGAYLAFGIAIWIGLQAFINIGVNMGLLPTKGLTLPLVSYGGSSMLATCAAMGLLFRVDLENRMKGKAS